MSTRNFCIIAHIDHGKSTLADRFIELTHTVPAHQMRNQVLDQMDLERERGITIKLQPVRMEYKGVHVNLIDTPGHVDFQYEVGRSLAAVEGAVLLVDATQGIQAQTLSTLYAALEQDLVIIPVVNKIDHPAARVEETAQELGHLLGVKPESVALISGKTGEGVDALLEQIITQVPPPQTATTATQLLVFDSIYDPFRGVVAYVRVVGGSVKTGQNLFTLAGKEQTLAAEVGVFTPKRVAADVLETGDIGYVVSQFKDVRSIHVGETLATDPSTPPLEGYKQVSPMVYASLFPIDHDQTRQLREALEKLTLNDAAISYTAENNAALGSGFRCGFLGALHLDIVRERLEREFGLELIATTPTVAYEVILTNHTTVVITAPADFPDPTTIAETKEPIAAVEIVTPSRMIGVVMDIAHRHRGEHTNTEYLDAERAVLHFNIPLAEIIVAFHDELKSATAGYGSFSYIIKDYRQEPLVRVDILVAGDVIPPLAQIVPTKHAVATGRRTIERLKEILPKQNFAVALQAVINGSVIARETLAAVRKDVTAKLYGGDVTRKRKLLEKQKKGKKRLARFGQVDIPSSVFFDVLKNE